MSHEKVLDILSKESEITWQDIIHELIKTEQMDPRNVDISLLSQKYLEIVKSLRETNFLLSGKVVLASAMLVKIKSNKLLEEDITHLDHILYPSDEPIDTFDYLEQTERPRIEVPGLAIKSPQARKRRISVQDLVSALERALEVNKRRILRHNALLDVELMKIPDREIDITALIESVFSKIKGLFTKSKPVTFTAILPENATKKDKIMTLFPLLVLDNDAKIELTQERPFGDIQIALK